MDLRGLQDLHGLHQDHLCLAFLYRLELDLLCLVDQQELREHLFLVDLQVGQVDHDQEDLRVGLCLQLQLLLEDQQVDHVQEGLKVGLDLVDHLGGRDLGDLLVDHGQQLLLFQGVRLVVLGQEGLLVGHDQEDQQVDHDRRLLVMLVDQ